MKIAILGASGYIGHNLINKLLATTEHDIVAIAPNATSIKINNPRLFKANVDVFDTPTLAVALKTCDMGYYLIHMMAQNKLDFAVAETKAANSYAEAAKGSRLKRVIYLGGLGSDHDKLSKHLASRHNSGQILRDNLAQVIEFRASMVIGDGSISYDIITNLVHKLPILTLPKWASTRTQPIGLADAIDYLVSALDVKINKSQIIEIGGPEQLSYEDLMKRYAKWKGRKALFIRLPIIPIHISAWWLNLFTPPRHAKVGIAMVESLANPMIVTNNLSKELFPNISPLKLEKVFV
jgi:uncharacterized protein YbjT (DUF2867 family)